MRSLKVLVGCEFSGIVRDAFRALGHEAYSCDLLPCEADSKFHFQKDVLELLCVDWDLLIAHPSCTYLCNSGVRWLYGGKGTVIDPARWQQMVEAATFFKALLNAPIARIALENPIPHRYALKEIGTPYSQIVQALDRAGTFFPAVRAGGFQMALLLALAGYACRDEFGQVLQPKAGGFLRGFIKPERLALAMAEQWNFT